MRPATDDPQHLQRVRHANLMLVSLQDASELVPPFNRQGRHRRLQNNLGAVIDVVETKWGGSTRQVIEDC